MITADVAATQALTFAIPLGVLFARDCSGDSSSADRPGERRGCRRAAPRAGAAPWRGWCLAGRSLVVLACPAPAARDGGPADRVRRGPAVLAPGHRRSRAAGTRGALAPVRDWPGQARRPVSPTRSPTGAGATAELPWSLAFIGCDLGVAVAWHAPAAVAAVDPQGWLVVVEAASLLLFGLGLWLELVASPPLTPRSGHLRRAVLGRGGHVDFWILAYVSGLSDHGFYRNFHHVAGGLSAAADQQIASAVLWFVAAAVAFAPVIFWNAYRWLKTEEDPDAELLALARAERRRGTPPLRGGRAAGL